MSVVREVQEHSFLSLCSGPGYYPSRQDCPNSLSGLPASIPAPAHSPLLHLADRPSFKKNANQTLSPLLKASAFPLRLEEKPVSLAGPMGLRYLPNLALLLSL